MTAQLGLIVGLVSIALVSIALAVRAYKRVGGSSERSKQLAESAERQARADAIAQPLEGDPDRVADRWARRRERRRRLRETKSR